MAILARRKSKSVSIRASHARRKDIDPDSCPHRTHNNGLVLLRAQTHKPFGRARTRLTVRRAVADDGPTPPAVGCGQTCPATRRGTAPLKCIRTTKKRSDALEPPSCVAFGSLSLAWGATIWSATCRGLRARSIAAAGASESSKRPHGRTIFLRLLGRRLLPAISFMAATSSVSAS